jgi:hypothetical protein
MDKNWLPEGHHWGLKIEHRRLPDAGAFTSGGHKLCWHTTEGYNIDAMWRVLRDKNAAPHFVIDPGGGDAEVYQCIALNRAARALEHPPGTPPTNTANCIHQARVPAVHGAGEEGDAGGVREGDGPLGAFARPEQLALGSGAHERVGVDASDR